MYIQLPENMNVYKNIKISSKKKKRSRKKKGCAAWKIYNAALRQDGASRHPASLIRSTLKPLQHHGIMILRDLRGATINLALIIPRAGVSISGD